MAVPEIKIRDDGPYKVTGPARLIDPEGGVVAELGAGEVAVLCRCGRSDSKPFCDASHRGAGFESRVRADASEAVIAPKSPTQ